MTKPFKSKKIFLVWLILLVLGIAASLFIILTRNNSRTVEQKSVIEINNKPILIESKIEYQEAPEEEPAINPSSGTPQPIGGQRDEHGCLGPAGYSWCESKQKCLRVWEEKCD